MIDNGKRWKTRAAIRASPSSSLSSRAFLGNCSIDSLKRPRKFHVYPTSSFNLRLDRLRLDQQRVTYLLIVRLPLFIAWMVSSLYVYRRARVKTSRVSKLRISQTLLLVASIPRAEALTLSFKVSAVFSRCSLRGHL